MAYRSNYATIIGNVGQGAERIESNYYGSMAKFTVACSQGKREDDKKPMWVNVKCFGYTADAALDQLGQTDEQDFGKGQPVVVVGRWSQNHWESDDGPRSFMEFIADTIAIKCTPNKF